MHRLVSRFFEEIPHDKLLYLMKVSNPPGSGEKINAFIDKYVGDDVVFFMKYEGFNYISNTWEPLYYATNSKVNFDAFGNIYEFCEKCSKYYHNVNSNSVMVANFELGRPNTTDQIYSNNICADCLEKYYAPVVDIDTDEPVLDEHGEQVYAHIGDFFLPTVYREDGSVVAAPNMNVLSNLNYRAVIRFHETRKTMLPYEALVPLSMGSVHDVFFDNRLHRMLMTDLIKMGAVRCDKCHIWHFSNGNEEDDECPYCGPNGWCK